MAAPLPDAVPCHWIGGDVSYDPNNTDFRIRLNRSFRFGNLLNLVVPNSLQRTDHAISEVAAVSRFNLTGPIAPENPVIDHRAGPAMAPAPKIVGDGQMSR